MKDADYVATVRRKWERLLNDQDKLGDGLAVATALFATMHMDRLLDIAGNSARHPTQEQG